MSSATQTIDIKINVTLADDSDFELSVHISDELYHDSEIAHLLEDTMCRAARALNKRIQVSKGAKR